MANDALQLLFLAVTMGVLPVLVNKSTERGRFDWIHPYLREIWTAIFVFYSWYLLTQPRAEAFLMWLSRSLRPSFVYLVLAIMGASLLCGYYWFAGKVFESKSSMHIQPQAE